MPRFLLRPLILAFCLPLLAACEKGVTPQQDTELRGVYDKMRVNDLAGVEGQFAPDRRQPALHQRLQFMQGMIPPDKPTVRFLKGLSLPGPNGATDYGAQYEYDYASTAVLAQIEMRQDKAGHKTLTAVQLRQEPVGIAHAFDFGLTGKKYYQYIFLFLMVLPPAFGVWGLYALWRAQDLKWKFFWALTMLLGFMDLTMDWRTGDVVLNLAYIHPFWIFARKFGPLSPWMLSTSLPLASIAFLLGYRRLERPWDGPKKKP
ncbi:MAG TPA: hypothetical protein VGM25_03960 [Caulobacteraceae bacterium]|jgi:hypothetical protein